MENSNFEVLVRQSFEKHEFAILILRKKMCCSNNGKVCVVRTTKKCLLFEQQNILCCSNNKEFFVVRTTKDSLLFEQQRVLCCSNILKTVNPVKVKFPYLLCSLSTWTGD